MEGGRKTKVLMFPWLAHGHLSGFLELAKSLARRNFTVLICSSAANLASVRGKIGGDFSDTIQLLELHIPALPDLPPELHTTNGLPPHLMPVLQKALAMAEPKFVSIMQESKPDLLIHDYIPPWAPAAARANNIPAVQFMTTSAVFLVYALHPVMRPDDEYPFPSIDYPENHPFRKLFKENAKHSKGSMKEAIEQSCGILLVKTFSEIEGRYMEYHESMCSLKVLPVPVVEEPNLWGEKSEIIEWLDGKEKGSTVFVSFGSEFFFSKEETEEVAVGLELSGVNFIWVVRFPTGEKVDLQEALPEGYLERVKGRGLAVKGWAPQGQILGHPNTGGFLSHCGWNSVMESVKLGVPIIAAPMSIDQPLNAKVLVEAGLGVEIERDEEWKLRREKVAEAIKHVMIDESGERLRRKAKEVSDALISKGEEDIDVVANELLRLCHV